MRTVRQLLEEKERRLIAIAPEAAVLDAIRLMAEHGIGAVLVMEGGRLVGILSERDYARKVILQGRSSSSTTVREVMSAPVVTVTPDHSSDACMQLVTHERIRHLPVVEDGRVVGVVSIGDLVKAVIEDQQEEIQHLHRYIAS
ncbi:CBS domain-containing protein [Rehaibacterium terrae]|jgi:CBS domain-containing protein|uniref:CBS domain-containing protein n=1 Tax=Rehaibacterium terrae TaxID=1341696 RepID=A0A7W8DEZ0_9GAMM|nr:CBS domain-containing protein [Rehaibacterium terrae]MBB5015945.1 CBS domain-containing protein [Rehaibacterium terrae]